jgi:uncharacterized membrane protein
MKLSHFIFGPQLVGIVLVVIGLIMQQYPPKKINGLYGYRTFASMKNQQTWDVANRYAARLMTVIGFWTFIAGVAVTAGLNYLMADGFKLRGFIAGISIVLSIVPALLIIILTEKHLDRTFNNKNEIR